MNKIPLKMDDKTKKRIEELTAQKYPNPLERANFEKLPLSDLQKILFVANKVKARREKQKESVIKCNPVSIRNIGDAQKFAQDLITSAMKEESLGSGLMGEAVLVASYSQLPIWKLDIQILELNREIKRKKDFKRVLNDAGNVDKLVNTAIPLDNQGGNSNS